MPVTMSTTPRGTTPRGTTPRGTTPRGTAPRGTTPRGTTPRPSSARSKSPNVPKHQYQVPGHVGRGAFHAPATRKTRADIRKEFQPPAPVSFNTFEVGRSSMPANAIPTAAFMDGTVRGIVYPHTDGVTPVDTGDPGQYDPFTGYNVG